VQIGASFQWLKIQYNFTILKHLYMNKIINIFVFFVIILLSSCIKEIPVTIPEFSPPNSNKVVLVEELTGVRCINCPDGALTLKNIENQYPGKIGVIAIHAGELSEPYNDSKFDLRCADAISLEKEWSYLGKPAAAIDRVIFEEPDIPVSGYSSWQQYIEQELLKENVINIEATAKYNALTRKGEVIISMLPLKDQNGTFKVFVALTENHIVDKQVKKDGKIDDTYEFENVLRDMITNYNGNDIGNSLIKNKLISKSFEFTLPESNGTWIPENMDIVAFVSGKTGDSDENILNSIKIKLVK
jgi:hypothetical protein